MKQILLSVCLLVLWVGSSQAQQLPLFSQQIFNRFGFNPACAGNKNRVETLVSHRNHMIGFTGAPTTQMLTVSAPWHAKNFGLGLRLMNDKIGSANHMAVGLAANYVVIVGRGKLSAGLEFGLDQYAAQWDEMVRVDQDDAVIPTGQASIMRPNAATGFFYTTAKWYLGYSVQNLVASKLQFQGGETMNVSRATAHHYLNAGGVIAFGDILQLEPYLLYKGTRAAPWQIDLGAFLVLKESYGIGITFRPNDALVYTAKLELVEQVYLGYSYETRMGPLTTFTSNSHEIMVGYYHNLLEPAKKKVIHPRYYF